MSHVDSPSPVTHVSLCAGYGGIDLGLHRAVRNLRTIAVSEIEAFACANLVAKMEAGLLDPAPIWTDLKTFPWAEFRDRVDILSGGYPCQPFSAAGKRLGAEDPRHLWPFISAGIAAMRPSACFFENVDGHISMGLPDVLQDLAGLGYRTTWCVASASECGAPHQRKRVFILAYDGNNAGAHFWSRFIDHRGSYQAAHVSPQAADQQAWRDCGEEGRKDASSNLSFSGCWSAELADSQCAGLEGSWPNAGQSDESESRNSSSSQWPSRPGEQQFAWEPPRVVADTASRRRLKAGSEFRSGEVAEDSGCQEGTRHQQAAFLDNEGCDGGDESAWPSRPGEQQFAWEPPRVVLGNASNAGHSRPARSRSECAQGQSLGHVAESDGAMGHPNSPRPQERPRQRGAGIQGADADGGAAADREAEFSMGDPAYGTPDGLGVAELSGLSGQELAEIRHWMVASDNRTDELRLLGNGVVPAVAERAFRLLVGELMEHQP